MLASFTLSPGRVELAANYFPLVAFCSVKATVLTVVGIKLPNP